MSHDPRLLVDWFSLDQATNKIEIQYWELKEPKSISEKFRLKQQLYYFLYGMTKQRPVYYKKERIVICHPELTTFNKRVRKWLDENNIYYVEEQ